MLFDPAKLPDKEEIKLSEVVHFLAFGETLDQAAQREMSSPSVRALDAEIEPVLKRCLEDVRANPDHAAFVEAIASDALWFKHPIAGCIEKHLKNHDETWPSQGQGLRGLIVRLDAAIDADIIKRELARSTVEKWFDSGEVRFIGKRGARRESIDRRRICDAQLLWEWDKIVAYPAESGGAEPGTRRPQLVWTEVVIDRASLIKWLRPPLLTQNNSTRCRSHTGPCQWRSPGSDRNRQMRSGNNGLLGLSSALSDDCAKMATTT